MGEEDAPPPAVETEEAPNAVEAPPAVDDHPVETHPVETPGGNPRGLNGMKTMPQP
jgi:hypothetical protein